MIEKSVKVEKSEMQGLSVKVYFYVKSRSIECVLHDIIGMDGYGCQKRS